MGFHPWLQNVTTSELKLEELGGKPAFSVSQFNICTQAESFRHFGSRVRYAKPRPVGGN
jgi:hypothetical protein